MAVDSDDKRPEKEKEERASKEEEERSEKEGEEEEGKEDEAAAAEDDESRRRPMAASAARLRAEREGSPRRAPARTAVQFLVAYGPSAALLLGLGAIFLGQRPFSHIDWFRNLLTAFGGIAILGAVVVRGWAFARAEGRQRQVELALLACYAGTLVALLGYALTTEAGVDLFGFEDEGAIARWQTALTVLWVIIMVVSLVPLIMVEATIGYAGRYAYLLEHKPREGAVETVRVREAVANGLTIALAASFLMVTCNVAEERNVRKDVSYFKTSSPGEATQNVARSLNEGLKVLLFFPDVNKVGDEVEAYFEALHDVTGNIQIERYDRMVRPALAKEHQATRNGTVVLVLGDKSEKFTLQTEFEKARRGQLRELDKRVNKALMKVVREERVAYLTVGHGELNDEGSERVAPASIPGLDRASAVKTWFRNLNYQVQTFQGLGKPVPDDASVLVILAPTSRFMEAELEEIDRYLASGGALLLALDPQGDFSLGQLEGRLGVKFDPTPLADDKAFARLRRGGQKSDHQYLTTTQVSSHAAVTISSRVRRGAPLVFLGAGSLEDAEFTTGGQKPKRSYPIRSMNSAFRDVDGDHEFDKGSEKRSRYNLMAAVEDPKAAPERGSEEPGVAGRGMRAIVITDAELFSDAVMGERLLILNRALVLDAIKWLGGEEEFIGETESEKDVAIVHTKSQDVIWFYATIVGAPLVVLGLGLAFVYGRRRRTQRRRS